MSTNRIQWKQQRDGHHGSSSSGGNTHYACTLLNTSVNFMLLLLLLLPRCARVCVFVRLFKYSFQIPIAFALKLAMPTTTATVRASAATSAAAARLCFSFFNSLSLLFFGALSHCVGRWSDSIWSKFLTVCGASRLHSLLKSFQFANRRVSRFST